MLCKVTRFFEAVMHAFVEIRARMTFQRGHRQGKKIWISEASVATRTQAPICQHKLNHHL